MNMEHIYWESWCVAQQLRASVDPGFSFQWSQRKHPMHFHYFIFLLYFYYENILNSLFCYSYSPSCATEHQSVFFLLVTFYLGQFLTDFLFYHPSLLTPSVRSSLDDTWVRQHSSCLYVWFVYLYIQPRFFHICCKGQDITALHQASTIFHYPSPIRETVFIS